MALHLRPRGKAGHPAILLLHGFMGSSTDWEALISSLENSYYLLAPDFPGFGKSENFDLDQSMDYATLSHELLKLLDDHKISSPILLGYSLGGRIAMDFSLRFPERVKALILESASPGISDIHDRQERFALDQFRARQILEQGFEAFLRRWYEAPLFASLAQEPARKEELIRKRLRENSGDLAAKWAAKVIVDLSPGLVPDLWPRLRDLPLPLLWISGALDEKYRALAIKAKEILPEAIFFECPNAGHAVHFEQEEEFLKILLAFLSTKN